MIIFGSTTLRIVSIKTATKVTVTIAKKNHFFLTSFTRAKILKRTATSAPSAENIGTPVHGVAIFRTSILIRKMIPQVVVMHNSEIKK
jgi:hypothetical protein